MKFQLIKVCKTVALTLGLQHSVGHFIQFLLEESPEALGPLINPFAVATLVSSSVRTLCPPSINRNHFYLNDTSVIYIQWAGSPLHHCQHKGAGRLHPHANFTSANAETSLMAHVVLHTNENQPFRLPKYLQQSICLLRDNTQLPNGSQRLTKAAQSQLVAFERKERKLYSNFQFADKSQGSLG